MSGIRLRAEVAKRTRAILLFLIVYSVLGFSQNAPRNCQPTTPQQAQSRTDLKHRKASSAKPGKTTIAEILNWAQPDHLWSKAVRGSNQPIDDRESKTYVVEGELWRVVLEGNDCDLHLELADVGKGRYASRIIAEIPQELEETRKKIISLLSPRDRDRLLNLQPNEKGNYRPINLKAPIRLSLTGYAFFDAHHYTTHRKTSKGGHCGFTPEQVLQRGYRSWDLPSRDHLGTAPRLEAGVVAPSSEWTQKRRSSPGQMASMNGEACTLVSCRFQNYTRAGPDECGGRKCLLWRAGSDR